MNNYNFKVVIDAGHGGSDPGAVANNAREKDLTLMISKYMYDKFKSLGVPVAITRTTDESLSPAARVNRILNAFGNSRDVIVISNHINSSSNTSANGAEVIYALRNDKTLAENILNALGNAGMRTRRVFQKSLPSNPNQDYYFIHRNTGVTEPLIVEYGFISNSDDLNKIKNNYKKYVDAVVNAIIYTKTGKSPITVDTSSYTVKSGDTLWKIAKNFNTTVNELKAANNLMSDNLAIGQTLTIPDAKTSSTTGNTYTVKPGDTLWKIANTYGTTVDNLKSINSLTSNTLMIGKVLTIPSGNKTYTVKAGDTLYKIARNFNTTVDAIKRLNNLTTNLLMIDQTLKIPN